MIRIGLVGCTGYTGLELLRYLSGHPHVQVARLFARSHVGCLFSSVFPGFVGLDIPIEDLDSGFSEGVDCLFFCLPHGESLERLTPEILDSGVRVIDLGADFRFHSLDLFFKAYQTVHPVPALMKEAVYGIPELFEEKIRDARLVANPGCYATSAILGLWPLVKQGLLGRLPVVDAKSGISGAGKTLKSESMFCEVDGHVSSYQTFVHRHRYEIADILGADLLFSPHLIPANRGIFSSVYVSLKVPMSWNELAAMYREFYKGPFVQLLNQGLLPSTQLVNGSNFVKMAIQVSSDFPTEAVIFVALDNLGKGAAGQAVQNFNVMFGLDPMAGLGALPFYL